MKDTKIEWAHHTFNPWEGCSKVSPGCAEARNSRFHGGTAPNWGKGAPRRRTSENNWNQPLKWDREAAEGERPRVFCASLADWLDPEVPIEWLCDLLDLIRRTPNLDWLLLTKRPELWRERMQLAYDSLDDDRSLFPSLWTWAWLSFSPPENVWIGTTVEDQQRADERIPALLKIPAKIRFLSCEPLLGRVDLCESFGIWWNMTAECWYRGDAPSQCISDSFGSIDEAETARQNDSGIHWVICGGESGPKARPMHPDWARSLRDQCQGAGIAFHFKQWGEWGICVTDTDSKSECVSMFPDGRCLSMDEWFAYCRENGDGGRLLKWRAHCLARVGKKAAGRHLDGKTHDDCPQP